MMQDGIVARYLNDHCPRETFKLLIEEKDAAFSLKLVDADPKAVVAFWTPDGEYVGPDGTTIRGREALARAYAGFLAKNPKLKVEVERTSVRFLSRDTAVEEGHFKVRKDRAEAPGRAQGAADSRARRRIPRGRHLTQIQYWFKP